MNVVLHRRAEIAFRYLDDNDHTRVEAALKRLKNTTALDLDQVPEITSLRSNHADALFAYDVGNAMRLVLSITAGTITVEDIAPKERLEKVA